MFVKERIEQGIENVSGTEFIKGPLPIKFNREAKRVKVSLGNFRFWRRSDFCQCIIYRK